MARTGVTYEDIAQAATKLLSLGESPTVLKIREVLGTGSNSTITEHLKYWKLQRSNRDGVTLPEALPQELMPPLETLWHIALEHADNRYLAHREQTAAQVEQLTTERDTWITQHRQTNTMLSECKTSLSEMEQALTQSTEHIQRIEEQNKILATEKQNLSETIVALKRELVEVREAHKNRELSLEAQQAEARLQWQATVDDLKTTIEQNHKRAEATEARWLRIVDQARDEVKHQKKQHEKIILQKEEALKQQQIQVQTLQEKVLEAHTGLAQKQTTCDVQQHHIEQLESTVTSLKEKISVLQKEAKQHKLELERAQKRRKHETVAVEP